MRSKITSGVAALFLFSAVQTRAEDIRVMYGATTFKAAQACHDADSLLRGGKAQDAIPILAELVKAEPGSAFICRLRLVALLDNGDFDSALSIGVDNFYTFTNSGRFADAYETAALLAKASLRKEKWGDAELWGSRAVTSLIRKTIPSPVEDAGKLSRMLSLVGKAQAGQGKSVEAVMNWLASQTSAPGHVDQKELLAEADKAPSEASTRNVLLKSDDVPIKEMGSNSAASNELAINQAASSALAAVPAVAELIQTEGTAVAALTKNGDVLLLSAEGLIRRIETNGKAACADFAAGVLFLGFSSPDKIEERSLDGKLIRFHYLPFTPKALAAFPSADTVCVMGHDGDLVLLNTVFETLSPASPFKATAIAQDRPRSLLYTLDRRMTSGQKEGAGVCVSKVAVGSSGCARQEIFLGLTDNSDFIEVSPDGSTIVVPGASGTASASQNSLLAISTKEFKMERLEIECGIDVKTVESFIEPDGALSLKRSEYKKKELSFKNAVFSNSGRLVAVFARGSLFVAGLAPGSKIHSIPFNGSGAAAFSGDGRLLYAGGEEKGVVVFNSPSAECGAPPADISNQRRDIVSLVLDLPVTESLRKFSPSKNYSMAKAAAEAALADPKDNLPPDWRGSRPLDPLYCCVVSNRMCLLEPEEAKKYLAGEFEAKPDHAGVAAAYGEFLGGIGDAGAEPILLKAVRLDAGRTSATTISLWRLGQILSKQGRDVEAAHCLAVALSIDAFNMDVNKTAERLFKRTGWNDLAGMIRLPNEKPSASP